LGSYRTGTVPYIEYRYLSSKYGTGTVGMVTGTLVPLPRYLLSVIYITSNTLACNITFYPPYSDGGFVAVPVLAGGNHFSEPYRYSTVTTVPSLTIVVSARVADQVGSGPFLPDLEIFHRIRILPYLFKVVFKNK